MTCHLRVVPDLQIRCDTVFFFKNKHFVIIYWFCVIKEKRVFLHHLVQNKIL